VRHEKEMEIEKKEKKKRTQKEKKESFENGWYISRLVRNTRAVLPKG
jgi:hypothetical protein